jgi:hypothetical protein
MVFMIRPPGMAFSQTGEGGLITEISLSGLKRTKPHVAEAPLRKFIGQPGAAVDLDAVHATILDTGILEPVSIEIIDAPSGEGKILKIAVREKWSILPLPVFFVDSGTINGGGAFMDTNAFGLNDKLILGGMYGSRGWTAFLMYMNTPDRERFPGWNLMGMYSRQEREDTDQREAVFRSFSLDSITASGGISYPFLEFFDASLGFSFDQRIIRSNGDSLAAPGEDAQTVGINPGISIRHSDWDGYLLSQQSASLDYRYTIGIGSPNFHSVSLRGTYERSLIPGFRVTIRSGILFDPEAPVLFESSPSAAQVNILPGTFSARHYGGISAGLEKYLFKTSFGTLSALVSYQFVYSQGPVLGNEWDHGVMGALSFYMSRLAIPALGLGIAYNVAADHLQGSFSVGMSF